MIRTISMTQLPAKGKPVERIAHVPPVRSQVKCECLACGYRWTPSAVVGLIECPRCLDFADGVPDTENEYEYAPFTDTRDGRSL